MQFSSILERKDYIMSGNDTGKIPEYKDDGKGKGRKDAKPLDLARKNANETQSSTSHGEGSKDLSSTDLLLLANEAKRMRIDLALRREIEVGLDKNSSKEELLESLKKVKELNNDAKDTREEKRKLTLQSNKDRQG
jgi:hypothetical protein